MILYDTAMNQHIYLGLDLGTTVLKLTAISDSGKILDTKSKELFISTPQPGWAEEFPLVWFETFQDLFKEIALTVPLKNVKAMGISGQMHGLIAYNKKMQILRPAIIWADKRSTSEVEKINDLIGSKKIYHVTGNPIFTGFLLPSLLWLKKNEAQLFKKISKISSPKDYIAYRLTGNLFSEPTDALATAAFDYKKNNWAHNLLNEIGIDNNLFPEIISTSMPYGRTTKETAKLFNIPEGIPVYGASDQAMAAMGCGLISEGNGFVAISTGGQFLLCAKKGILDKKQRLHTLNHAIEKKGLYMAATLSAGNSLKWFKSNIIRQMDTNYDTFIKGVENIQPGTDGLFFLPFLAGERTPYFNPYLKGAFIGLGLNHNQVHMARAIMEGVSYSFRECLETFKDLNMPISEIILSGGGTKNPTWRQMIVDVLNKPAYTINIDDHSPYGAAVFAKFAPIGFKGLEEFYKKAITKSRKIIPIKKNVEKYNELFKSYKQYAEHLNKQFTSEN